MSWLGGYNPKPSTSKSTSEADAREEKRKKLEAERLERLDRAQKRVARQKQLQAAIKSQEEANQALQELLDIAPDLFEGELPEGVEVDISILEDEENIMVDFERENVDDDEKAMDNLRSVQCPFNKEDIEFWFSQLEDQLTLIGVKKQWTKKIALVRFLPAEIQIQVKSLLKLTQTNAGTDIYLRIKKQLLKMYGPKPEDGYVRAKNRVLSEKPSQLGKLIVEDICPGELKLSGCHCSNTVWGLFREKIPIVVRNHIADMPFNANTYEAVFDKADQVYESNQGCDPVSERQTTTVAATEVASVQRSQKPSKKNKNKSQKSQNVQGQSNSGQSDQKGQDGQAKTKALVNEEKLCRIHAKWKEEANFCAAPWGCKMKNIYKAPQ